MGVGGAKAVGFGRGREIRPTPGQIRPVLHPQILTKKETTERKQHRISVSDYDECLKVILLLHVSLGKILRASYVLEQGLYK